MTDIIIIGGGVVGSLSAYYLGRAGLSVTLLEGADHLAAGASGMNAAQLSYSYVSPLGNPAIFGLMARMLKNDLPDVRVTKWIDPQLWAFGTRLLLQSSQATYHKNQEKLLQMALRSRQLMQEFVARHEIPFDHQHNGKLHLFVSDAQRETARGFSARLEKLGIRQDILSPAECLARVPQLQDRRGRLAGGLLSHVDDGGDCGAFTQYLPRIFGPNVTCRTETAVKRLIIRQSGVAGVQLGDGTVLESKRVLVCAGADSYFLLRDAGIRVPLYPVKGYSTTIPQTGIDLAVNVTDHHRRCVFAPLGDRLRVSGCMHFSGYDRSIPADMPAHYKKMITDVFPQADVSSLTLRSGLRPYLPDSVPRTEATAVAGLYMNIGHAMLGWTLAHATAEKMCDIISGVSSAPRQN